MVKFHGFNADEMAKLERAFSDKPNYKTKTGYTGNRKRKGEKKDWVIGKKRRKTDHLTMNTFDTQIVIRTHSFFPFCHLIV